MERVGNHGCNEEMKYLYYSIMNGVCNLVSELLLQTKLKRI